MPTEKTRVRVTIIADADPNDKKTTIPLLYSIQKLDDEEFETYGFPTELQPLRLHTELVKNASIAGAARSLKNRNQFRKCIVTLPKTASDVYFDSEGNCRYSSEYLEEIEPLTKIKPMKTQASGNTREKKSIQAILKDAVIDKFDGSGNAETWIQNFEKECTRLLIELENYSVALRLLLDGIAKDWYTTTFNVIGNSAWDAWRQSFIEYFAAKGWTESTYAVNYKFIGGSLSEYTIRKLKIIIRY